MIDADVYQSLNWMLQNDITDIIDREFTVSRACVPI